MRDIAMDCQQPTAYVSVANRRSALELNHAERSGMGLQILVKEFTSSATIDAGRIDRRTLRELRIHNVPYSIAVVTPMSRLRGTRVRANASHHCVTRDTRIEVDRYLSPNVKASNGDNMTPKPDMPRVPRKARPSTTVQQNVSVGSARLSRLSSEKSRIAHAPPTACPIAFSRRAL